VAGAVEERVKAAWEDGAERTITAIQNGNNRIDMDMIDSLFRLGRVKEDISATQLFIT
jgi:hypothetical protein